MRAASLDRCPPRWRPACLVFAASRAWRRSLLLWGLALPMVALMARARAELGMAILMYAPPLIALAVIGAPFTLLRRPVVWTTVFARAGAGSRDCWRLAALGVVVTLVAVGGVATFALAGLRAAAPLPTTGVISLLLFVAAWSFSCTLAAVGAAAVVRRGVAGALILWLLVPAGFTALAGPAGLPPSATHAVKILAPPLEAAVRLHDLFRGLVPADVAPWFVAQLVGFPLVALGLFGWRATRLAARPGAVE
ncbi:MAG: hypothetical protein RL340_441 [Gemmatimonadota bacterium]